MAITCPKCQHENPDDTIYCGKCATSLPSSEEIDVTETIIAPKEELTRGTTLASRYEIIEELGKGGMGRVYRVEDTKLKQEVALKLIKPEIAQDKKTIERFRNELKIARDIRHKNVCGMYDLGEEQGSHYITMEYVAGEDLKGMIRMMGQLGTGKALSIAKQVCEGLEEAHRLGVVHRDLKPSNIMIDKNGNARIMDFGIARSLESKGITGVGVMIGTPEYMSPEQVEGKDVDRRSDVYSLGVILYEMVTGRVPFEGDTPFTIGVKHKSEIPRDPKEWNAQIPEDLSRVIMRCLEKDKEKRYQSAGEVRSSLEDIERGIPTTERVVPERKPLTSREITVTLGMKKLLIPVLAIIALAVVAIVIWRLLPSEESLLIPQDKPSLAVMYFKNNTGDTNYDHWRSALSDLLISDLAQSKYIHVMGGDKLYNMLEQLDLLEADNYSSADLKRVASRGGVNHILLGNLTKAGDNFRINITLQEADTGELIGTESVDGIGEASIISMVDELTTKIKRDFKLSDVQIESDIDRHIGEVTTKSSEAYKYYHEGMRFDIKGDYPKVIEYMEKAVAVDPEFASAYHAMSWAYGNQGYRSEEKKFLKKAMDLSDRLSDREKYAIQGAYYFNLSEKTYDKAIEAYEKLLELYPDDLSGNNHLGILYSWIGEWDKAIESYENCIKYGGKDIVFYLNLAGQYRIKGLFDTARQVLEQYLDNVSDNAFVREDLALNYLFQGKYELALAEVDKALSLDPDHWRTIRRKGDVFLYMGDLKKAEEEYTKLHERKEPNVYAWGLQRLSGLYLLQGKFNDARKVAQEGLELSERLGQHSWIRATRSELSYVEWRLGNYDQALELLEKNWKSAVEDEHFSAQRGALLGIGLTYLKMKSMNEAQKTADELKTMIEQAMNKKLIRNYYTLMGMIELEKSNYSKAIEFYKKAAPLLSVTSSSHLSLAYQAGLAYYEAGGLASARQEYERAVSLTTGRQDFGDLYSKSFYMLGKIYEQQGDTAKAIEHYEKFLDLWKDADPGIIEVEDAGERLSSLKTQ
ncbi:MAG: protein kinase [Candidatus Aminicenantes bacterium]|jgi:serine/threonine protein kinase/tetratricopeptide (TPR) repeat protein